MSAENARTLYEDIARTLPDEILKVVSFVWDVTISFRQKPIELPLIELIEKET